MTQFYATSNPRNLMQFLTLRNDKHALAEIRDVAVQMEDIFAEKMPMTASAYRKYREIERWAMEQANQTTINNTLDVQTTTVDPRKVAEQMVRQANLIKGKVKA
jgi:thymidylate synthase ThyX